MRKLIVLLLITSISTTVFSQVVHGIILERGTNTPVCYATIYFNGTFVGTTSNKKGKFKLNISKNKTMPLTISAIGYYSVTLDNLLSNNQLIIHLKPKVYNIKDVVINAKSLERKRKRNLRIFKEEFIGTTTNSQKCQILNEQDITFNYHSDNDTIKAYALKPIQIENKSLGYKITYYLDKFEYYKKTNSTFFSGNFIFSEDLNNNNTDHSVYNNRRNTTYLGSRMHFIRVLSSGYLENSGFIVKNSLHIPVKIDEIVSIGDNNNKFLRDTGKDLIIEYDFQKTVIEFLQDSIYFDKSGFFNPGLKWWGEMGQQRIADWLPYEYSNEQQ